MSNCFELFFRGRKSPLCGDESPRCVGTKVPVVWGSNPRFVGNKCPLFVGTNAPVLWGAILFSSATQRLCVKSPWSWACPASFENKRWVRKPILLCSFFSSPYPAYGPFILFLLFSAPSAALRDYFFAAG